MTDEKRPQEGYDPPEVEQIPTDSGPAATAAGGSGPQDNPPGPEWRPADPANHEEER